MLRVALVGAGGMARHYRACYARLSGVEWVLAVDVNDAELEACKQLGVKQTSHRFEDALAEGIDLIDISTPNFLHEEQAVAALRAGKHVLLQKPMANTLEAADRIVEAAKSARGVLGMFMSSYTQPLYWDVKQMIVEGALGQIQSVRARDAHRGGLHAKPTSTNWRSSRELTGGGSFVQLSIHAINLIQWLLDSPIVEVTAFSDNRLCPNIGGDDVTVMAARFGNHVYGTFDSGYASDLLVREIYGTKGFVRIVLDHELEMRIDGEFEGKLVKYHQPGQLMRVQNPVPRFDDVGNSFNQHRMFVEALQEGRRPHMQGEEGRRDLAVVQAAYRSAQERRAIEVK